MSVDSINQCVLDVNEHESDVASKGVVANEKIVGANERFASCGIESVGTNEL